MRFYQGQHRHTCGVDLHGRNLYLSILDQQGEVRLHRKLRCDPELFLQTIPPYSEALVEAARTRCGSAGPRSGRKKPQTPPLFTATAVVIRKSIRSVQGLAAYTSVPANLTHGEKSYRIQAQLVTADFVQVLGIQPSPGRGSRPTGDPGEERSVVPVEALRRH